MPPEQTSDRSLLGLPLADDKDHRRQGVTVFADFVAYLLVAKIGFGGQPAFLNAAKTRFAWSLASLVTVATTA